MTGHDTSCKTHQPFDTHCSLDTHLTAVVTLTKVTTHSHTMPVWWEHHYIVWSKETKQIEKQK